MGKRRIACLLLCLLLVLCTACGAQPDSDSALRCTVTIECGTVLGHMDDLSPGKAELIPSDGVLLPETAVAFSEGDTVFDVLQRVCRAQGIHMESNWTPAYNSAYIEGIGNLRIRLRQPLRLDVQCQRCLAGLWLQQLHAARRRHRRLELYL